MPSFDTVSEVDQFEINNAVDQANRELKTRYDFKGVESRFERNESEVELTAEADIQLEQMLDILRSKLVNRSIDVKISLISRNRMLRSWTRPKSSPRSLPLGEFLQLKIFKHDIRTCTPCHIRQAR